MPRVALAAASFVLGLALIAAPASGSFATALDLRELVTRADHVVLGTAVDATSRFHRDILVTDVTITVEEALKGDATAGRSVHIRLLGGAIGRIGLRVSGEASIVAGERAILFAVGRDLDAPLRPVGMAQGVLHVRAAAGEPTVHGDARATSLVERTTDGRLRPAAPAVGERALSDVLDEIRALVRETTPRGTP